MILHNCSMVYKTRFLESIIKKATASSAAVVVTGPRQAGKTSLLSNLGRKLFPSMEIISFDSPAEMDEFGRDPGLFFVNHPGVLLLDEIQHVPNIFPYLKREIDKKPGKFRFFISGSQVFPLMRHVAESLAGRAVIL
ncbi:MAG: AAA family ATPase, partial [Kiritimatiellia bacterium]|nr:AAA family ATPase [Kiritimatiellia bacterium]